MKRLFDTQAWAAITETAAEMHRLIEETLVPGGALADIDGLHGRLLTALEALGPRLPANQRGGRDAYLAPIAMLFDERILGRLSIMSMGSALDWPSLLTAVDGTRFAGDVFFRRIDAMLQPGEVLDPLLPQVYLWCLEQGFLGRFADEPSVLDDYRARLWKSLEQPELPTEAPVATEVARYPGLPRARTLVLLVLLMALAWQGILVLATRSVTL